MSEQEPVSTPPIGRLANMQDDERLEAATGEGLTLPRRWPIVGRRRELSAMVEGLSDDGAGVYLTGPAGVGKSRLVQEAGAARRSAGVDVVEITGVDAAAAIPLAPLLRLVDFDAEGDVARLVLRELARRAERGQVLVIVDDAHHLDAASAAVIHQVAQSGLARLIVATRTGEPTEGAIQSLWKDGRLTRLDVSPLDRPRTTALVEQVLGPVSSTVIEWCWAHSHGHPLYLRELITGAAADGVLVRSGDTVEYRGEGTLPRGLLDLVDAHIDRIGDGALVALAAVSLVQPARRSVVEAAASADALHALTQHQLVVIDGGQNGTVTLSHPLYGETARRRVGARQLDELRLILAEALHDDGAPDINSVALLLDAGAKPDLPALQETTAQLLRLRQGPLAERFARALTDRQPDATAAAHLAASLAIQHRNDEADTFYRQAITEATDPDEQAAIWLGWIRSVFEYRADPGVAIPLADEARHALHGSDRQLATCIWLMSRMFVEPLEPVLDALLRLADHPDVDIRARPIIALNVATSAWHCGYPALTAEWTRRGLHSGEAQTITEGRMRQVEVAGAAWGQSIIEARQRTERFADWVAVNRDLDAEMHLLAARTLVAARAGTAQATVDAVDRFMDLSRRAADRRANGLLSGEWALAASALADRDADTEQALAVLAAMPARARINGEVLEAVARSRMANRRGSADEARRHLHHALDRARWRNSRVHEAITLRELHAWFGPTEETVSRMEELAERAGPGLFRLHAIEARAHLDGDGTALAALSVEAETYGAIGMAWESAAAAYTAHRETGDLAGALAAEIRVEMLGRELPGQLSPLVAAIEPVLSMREREVASAVAAGATNAQAAEQLFLSPRTVQRHLERIFQRLDVGNRGALAELVTVEHRPS